MDTVELPTKEAVRSKRYRDGKKKKVGRAAYRELERNRKRAYRKAVKKEKAKYKQQKEHDRERKKKDKTPQNAEAETASTSFSTRQSLGRSIRKAESALPNDTPKKVTVLKHLCKKLTPSSKKKLFLVSAKV